MDNAEKVKNIALLEAEVFSNPWTAGMIEDSVRSDYDHIEVIEEHGALRGYIIYSAVCDSADLLRVAVAPESRGQGLGKALMDRMLADCSVRNIEKVFLEVRESNSPAIHMYARCGFTEIARRKNYYSSPVEDGIVMQLELPKNNIDKI